MARHVDLQAIVNRQDGSDTARERAAVLLRVMEGTATMEESAQALGLSTQRLHELRERVIAGVVASVEPQPPGRPRSAAEPDVRDVRIAELEAQVGRLRFELECAFLKTELTQAFGDRIPSLKKNAIHPGETGERQHLTRRQRRLRDRQQRKVAEP